MSRILSDELPFPAEIIGFYGSDIIILNFPGFLGSIDLPIAAFISRYIRCLISFNFCFFPFFIATNDFSLLGKECRKILNDGKQ